MIGYNSGTIKVTEWSTGNGEPVAFTVSGAGTEVVNGTYVLTGEIYSDMPVYGISTGPDTWGTRCAFDPDAGNKWVFHDGSWMDMYYISDQSAPSPWSVTSWSSEGFGIGEAPMPTVTPGTQSEFALVSLSNYEVARVVSGTVEQVTDKDAIVNRTTGTTIYRDQQMQLLYVGAPNVPIVWTSSNEEVATVDSDGFVTHLTTGTTTITATAGAQSLQKTLDLTVSTPSIADELVDYVAGSLAKSASDAIDDLIEGKSAATALKLFTTQNHSAVTRTNKILWSGDISNEVWTKNNVAVAASSEVAPFGLFTPKQFSCNSTGTVSDALHQTNRPISAGTRHTLSAFVKAGNAPFFRFILANSANNQSVGLWLRMSDGVITQTNEASGTLHSYGVSPVGDGWYRVWLSATIGSNAQIGAYCYIAPSSGSTGRAAGYVHLGGFQLEATNEPTNYIPTEAAESTVTAPHYLRNGNFWGASLGSALCSISPWNTTGGPTRAGVAISDLHIIFAAHYPIGNGATVRFVLADNTVVTRTLVSRKTHPEYTGSSTGYAHDLTVGLLDSPLPAGVVPVKILPADYQNYLPSLSLQRSLPALCLDQEEKGLVTDLTSLTSMASFSYPNRVNWEKRAEFYESKIGGDSGNPAFLVVNGELVLLTVWTFGGAGSGTSIVHDKNAINLMMSQLGGGRQLTEIDLSGFTNFVPPPVYDVDAQDYFDRVSAAGSSISLRNKAAVDQLVRDLKAEGLWDKLKAACLLAGPDTLSGALVPLRADMPTPTNFNFVAGDYSRATGLKGNGASKHLVVGLYGDDLPKDDMHASVWVTSAHTPGAVGAYMSTGGSAGPSGAVNITRSANNPANGVVRANSVSASSITGVGGDVGMWGVSRASATSYVASIGSVDTSVSVSSTPPLHNEFTLYRFATDAGGWVDGRLAWYSAGLSIDLPVLRSILTAYMSAII